MEVFKNKEFDITEPTENEIREMELRKLNELLTKENNYIELDEYENEELQRLLNKYSVEE